MRNTKEYPITAKEAERVLRNLAASIGEEMRLGDIRPLVLKNVADFLRNESANFDLFVRGE